MKNGKVQVGIIGCGGIGHAHANNYLFMNDVEIVALADIVPGKAEKFKKDLRLENARVYNSDKELLDNEKELDCVSVCTYNRQHAPCAINAMRHGLPVLLEKPMCVTLEEALELYRVQKETGVILSVGFQPRYDKNMMLMKDIIRIGELGKVYYIQTGGGRRRGIPSETFIKDETAGIGALGDIGCYSLDMCLDAIGYPKPLTVTAYTSNWIAKNPKYFDKADEFSVDDFAAAFIRLEGGVVIDFRIAWAMNIDSPGDTIFLGTEGGLRVPATDCWNGEFDGMTLYKTVNFENTDLHYPKIPHNGMDNVGCFYFKLRAFIEAVMYGKESPIPLWQMVYNQAILDGIVRSAKLGHEVDIIIPELD